MQISKPTENDIAKIDSPKPITFLASNADGCVRVIHISYTSKDLSMVADIDLETNKVALLPQDDARTFISVFIGHNCKIDGYRELETSGCDLSFIVHYPVLAHPERYLYMSENDYLRLKSMNIQFQLNLFSLFGLYGKEVQKRAKTLQKQEMYNYIGTDLHRIITLQNALRVKL